MIVSIPAIWAGEAQVALAEKAFALWPAAYKVVDPVMGDNGKAYSTVTPALVERIRSLCRRGRSDFAQLHRGAAAFAAAAGHR